jgi:ankyrin repeat protein
MNNLELFEEFKDSTELKLNTSLTNACEQGDLEKVKFLLTSTRLSNHANVNYFDSIGFICACIYGQLEVVRYLLTSPELKEHANINVQNNLAIKRVCFTSHVDVIKYLLTSSELSIHADIHADADDAFKNAYIAQHHNVLQYLILEFKIQRTEEIDKFIKENPNEEIEKMFVLRELNDSLEKELNSDNINNKRIKI